MGSCPCKPNTFTSSRTAGVSAYNSEAWTQGAQRGRLQFAPPRRTNPPGNTTIRGNADLPNSTGFNKRTLPREIILARYLPTGTGGVIGQVTATALVYTPSSRLRLSIVAAFEPDNTTTPDPAFVVAPVWSIRAMSQNPQSGREVPLQLAYPPPSGSVSTMPLPDAYELDSAVKLLRVNCTLQDTNFSTAYVAANVAVNLILYATWEPNVAISDDERDFLYGQCAISAQAPKLINNSAA